MFAPPHARSELISERLRRALREQISPGTSLCPDRPRRNKSRELRPGRITNGNIRRQFKLARPGLVPDQLFTDRISPTVSSLLRRRFQSGMSYRLRAIHGFTSNRRLTFQSVDQDLDA